MNNKFSTSEINAPKRSFERNLSLGIDCGTYAFRYVLCEYGTHKVVEWGGYELEREPAQRGKSSRELGTFISFLKDLARRIPKARIRHISVKLPGQNASTGLIEIPEVSEKERPSLAELCISKQISYPVEQACYCFADVVCMKQMNEDASQAKTCLSFAAAPKSVVMKLIEAVQEAFEPVPDITIQGYALESLTRLYKLVGPEEAIAFIDIGKSSTIVSVFQDSHFVFERNIPIGSHDLTRAIMIMYLDSETPRAVRDLEHAETLKKKSFIPTDKAPSERRSPLNGADEQALSEEENQRLFKAMQGILTALLHDIRLTLNFYTARKGSVKLTGIYLLGGGSELGYFSHYLAEKLALPVRLLEFNESIVQITPSAESDDFVREFHRYATAFALSLKPKGYTTLTPREFKTAPLERVGASIVRIFFVVLFSIFLCWYFYLNAEQSNLELNRNLLWQYKAPLKQVERPYIEMLRWQKFMANADFPVAKITEVLKALSQVTPSNVIFSSVAIERSGGQIVMAGIVYGDVKKRAVTLTEYSKSLLASPYFQHVDIKSLTADQAIPGVGKFQMTAQLIKQTEEEKPRA